ncbi:MAG: UDP-N-acetylmuramate--alanine ligase [Candidatus Tokpelaia sp. JSC161]|nr:MAG: UDP-N-acetylmuramate--alanine ligase [Candidatus Tokpelaia sp. JSC161]
MPLDIGPIHVIGIGGIGMSAIADILHNLGYKVQGSDEVNNANVVRLRKRGIPIFVGHRDENLANAELVVISTAIKQDNCEYLLALKKGVPVIQRAEMLAELMRFRQTIAIAGTHGKSTTTSLIAALLDMGGFDPTVVNGGIINAYSSNTRMGSSNWMIVEADESDGTFLHLPVDVAVLTSIDPEHLDYYGTIENMRQAFYKFVEKVSFYGFAVMCLDDPEVKFLVSHVRNRRVITYGSDLEADVRYLNYRIDGFCSFFDIIVQDSKNGVKELKNLVFPMIGQHNVLNAVAAVAVAHECSVSYEAILQGLASFRGVHRRLTHIGSWNGIEIFDDYAHHPVEIMAVLKALRAIARGKVIAIVQPHRYSRLSHLLYDFSVCFSDADIVALAPVYTAGEEERDGINTEALIIGIRRAGHNQVHYIGGQEDVAPFIRKIANFGDYIIFMGAGNITQWAYALPHELEFRSK